MRNTLKMALFFLVLVAVLLFVPSISKAAEITADPEEPDTADLVAVVNGAEDGSTITLAGDYKISNVIELRDKSITIDGDGHTISGNWDAINALQQSNKSLIVAAENCTITLVDVNLTVSPKYGAQAYNGGKLILDGVDIRNCDYGGVLNNGGIVEIRSLNLGRNGSPSNNGIEIGKGSSLADVEIEPVLIMSGTLTSDQTENVIYIASNDELTSFEVQNELATTLDRLYVDGNKVIVTDQNNFVKFESNESDRVEPGTGEEYIPNPVVTLDIMGMDPVVFETKIGTVFTKEALEAKVDLTGTNLQIDGFFIDPEYTTAFDFRGEVNGNITIYVKLVEAGPTEEPTDPSEDVKDEGEKDDTPKTGVSTYIGIATFAVIASLATIVVIKKKNS